MRVTTLETFAGRMIEETLGVVRGAAIWTRRINKNSTAGHRALEHMTMDEMAAGLAEVREKAEAGMVAKAITMGADGIIAVKIEMIELGNDMYQAMAYGTAVKSAVVPSATPAFSAPVYDKIFGRTANDFDAVVLPFQPRRSAGLGANPH
jgi:uncharacterized protein YbjQ (UPF0145 family)